MMDTWQVWPHECHDKQMKPYYAKKEELTIEENCPFTGYAYHYSLIIEK